MMKSGLGCWSLISVDLVHKSEQDSQSQTPLRTTKIQSHRATHFVLDEEVLLLLLQALRVLNCSQLLHRSVSRKAKALCSLVGLALTLKCFGFCLCDCLLVLHCQKKKTISKLIKKTTTKMFSPNGTSGSFGTKSSFDNVSFVFFLLFYLKCIASHAEIFTS